MNYYIVFSWKNISLTKNIQSLSIIILWLLLTSMSDIVRWTSQWGPWRLTPTGGFLFPYFHCCIYTGNEKYFPEPHLSLFMIYVSSLLNKSFTSPVCVATTPCFWDNNITHPIIYCAAFFCTLVISITGQGQFMLYILITVFFFTLMITTRKKMNMKYVLDFTNIINLWTDLLTRNSFLFWYT